MKNLFVPVVLPIFLSVALSGCAQLGMTPKAAEIPATDPALAAEIPAVIRPSPRPSAAARTVEQFDTTTKEDRAAAVAIAEKPTPKEALLGKTIASLGNPADPGFWLETPLVSAPTQGRVEYPGSGKSVAVELKPIPGDAGAGSRLSLPAMRLLEAPLTGLPEVLVYKL
ncbi:MAG: hypothetical protein ACJA06_001321 [Halocynthiibacter sp.]|jgi:hypothetical protein